MRLIMVVSFSAGWAGLSEGAGFRGRGTPGAAEGGGSWDVARHSPMGRWPPVVPGGWIGGSILFLRI